MAIITSNLILMQPPKTGTGWVRAALDAAGVEYDRFWPEGGEDRVLHGHPDLEMVADEVGDRPVVTVVRHPWSWLKSYWAHRQRRGAQPCGHLIHADEGGLFRVFVESYLRDCPGAVSRFFERYGAGCGATMSIRSEGLSEGVCDVVLHWGREKGPWPWTLDPVNMGFLEGTDGCEDLLPHVEEAETSLMRWYP